MEWLKHAFAVESAKPQWNARQLELADQVCRAVVRRGMTTPALMFLESGRPLNFLASQGLVFLMPFVRAVTDSDGVQQFADFLESREAIEHLCRRLEELSSESRPNARSVELP